MRPSLPLRILATIVLVTCLAVPTGIYAYSQSDVNAHKKAAAAARAKAAAEQKRANDLLKQTQTIEDRIASIEKDIAALGGEIGTASQRRAKLDQEIELTRQDIATKQTQIGGLQTEYDARVAALNERADITYRNGDWAWLEMVLSAKDLSEFIQRTEYVTMIMTDDEQAATELETTRTSLETLTAALARAEETLSTKRAEVVAQEQGLRTLEASASSKRNAARTAANEKAALLKQSKKNIARLKAMALAEEQESARIAALLKGGASHGSGIYAGTFRWPTPGYTHVSSPFGMRMHPILHVWKMHTGIDIHVPYGARIVAAGNGTVIFAGRNGGYGNFTMIDHGNGLVTCYAHQSRIVVSKGQRVSAGTTIGYVGSTGLSTGPHLHFEVRVNGTPKNPMNYL
jgi:murein DD-endopeptidase MepM/ murein hydrolase activator NlpD